MTAAQLAAAMQEDARVVRSRAAREWPGEFGHRPGMTKDLRNITQNGSPTPTNQILAVLDGLEGGLWIDAATACEIAGRRFDGRKVKTLMAYVRELKRSGRIESRMVHRVLQIRRAPNDPT